jgi:IPT/TIG domain-containing protein
MRSGALARIVMASLGVSVVITLGCGKSPTEPSPPAPFSVLSISPPEGPTVLATIAKIAGTGFQSGDTVTVDGSRVDATILSATTISLSVTHSLSVPGGYRYAVIPRRSSASWSRTQDQPPAAYRYSSEVPE